MATQESESSSVKDFPGGPSEGRRRFPGGRRFLRWILLAKKFCDRLRVLFRLRVKPETGFQNQDISSETKKNMRGRPTIGDNVLLGSRNAWISLLEQWWQDVGWPLLQIRNRRKSTIEDIRAAFEVLDGKPNYGLVAPFFRDSIEAADASELRKNRKRYNELYEETQNKQFLRNELTWHCTEAEAALREAGPEEKHAIQLEADRRKARLNDFESSLRQAEEERDTLDKKLRAQDAFYRRTELLDYLHSRGRYAVEPRSLANALAGLPLMGWRQSYSRCSRMPYEVEPHLWYRVLKAVEEIWGHRSGEFEEAPVEFFRVEVLKLPKKYGFVRDYLWQNWHDLRLAIEECWRPKPSGPYVPFAITSLFVTNVTQQKAPTDRILADLEKLGT